MTTIRLFTYVNNIQIKWITSSWSWKNSTLGHSWSDRYLHDKRLQINTDAIVFYKIYTNDIDGQQWQTNKYNIGYIYTFVLPISTFKKLTGKSSWYKTQ